MRPEERRPVATEAFCIGEALVDLVATGRPGRLAAADTFARAPGGAPLNVAVGLARLGRRSGFIGTVGADAFGDLLHDVLTREGIDDAGLRRHPAARTTLAFVAEDERGGREILFYRHPGADGQLTTDDLPADRLAAARLLHFGTLSLSTEPARSATLAAIARARAGGALISCDVNLRLSLWPDRAEALAWAGRALALADVAKLSEEELALVAGAEDLTVASARARARGPALVAVTRGADGGLLTTDAGRWAAPGLVVPVVDTTGAGDGFMAGLLAGLLALGCPARSPAALPAATYPHLLTLANAVGALTTTRPGAIPGLPTAAEVRAFLADRGGAPAAADLLAPPA